MDQTRSPFIRPENVFSVAKSGGQYKTIQAAIDAAEALSPSIANPMIISPANDNTILIENA